MNITDTKILLSNYPNQRQEAQFGQVGGNEVIDIQCGYDIKVDPVQVTLQIANDLITAILTYDHRGQGGQVSVSRWHEDASRTA